VKPQDIAVTAYFEFTTYGNEEQVRRSIERLEKQMQLSFNPTCRLKGARVRGLEDQPYKKPAKRATKKEGLGPCPRTTPQPR
jgi:hypothetical protein